MISIRPHTALDYARLDDIDDEGVGDLSDSDRAFLNDVGDFLGDAGLTDRFGVTLLHHHFPISDGEQCVQRVDRENRSTSIHPEANAEPDLIPTNLKFDACCETGDIQLVGLEYTEAANLGTQAPINASDGEIFTTIRQIVRIYEVNDRWGLRLIHDPLGMGDDVMLETCDKTRRVLTSIPTVSSDPGVRRGIPTEFRWQRPATLDAELDRTYAQKCHRVCKATSICLREGCAPARHHSASGPHDRDHV